MNNEIPAGTPGRQEITVTAENTAKALGSGTLEVFATPAMICLMENTAAKSVEKYLDSGFTTVGSSVDAKHLSPSPVGMKIVCETEIVSQNGAKITFSATVYDEKGVIGKGTHERFVVNSEKFMKKAYGKQ